MNNECEFRVTMLADAGLCGRLTAELLFLKLQLQIAWPRLKEEPVAFIGELLQSAISQRRGSLRSSIGALGIALSLVLSAVLIAVFIGQRSNHDSVLTANLNERVTLVEFDPAPATAKDDQGIGRGSNGRVGFRTGKGEGSGPEPRKSTGGGSGGNYDKDPAQAGKLPPPSEIEAPIPQLPPSQPRSLPVAGIDIDRALWQDMPLAVYGDPRSTSSTPSNGPGDGGGMGSNKGTGVGDGEGPGFGPGSDGNTGGGPKGPPGCCGDGGARGNAPDDPNRVYPAAEVTQRARVLAKPEPHYTEEARRNAITGSVVLRVVFSRTGEVTNIRAVQALPFGLTERAIIAARSIRFQPALKGGQPVNVYMQLEYNFNLY